jgi:hypothetical protein
MLCSKTNGYIILLRYTLVLLYYYLWERMRNYEMRGYENNKSHPPKIISKIKTNSPPTFHRALKLGFTR